MAFDLSPVIAAEMQIARLDLPDDAVFIFGYNHDTAGWTVVFTLDQSGTRDWSAVSIDNLAVAKDFVRFQILDFTGLEAFLNQSEAVRYGEYVYKISRVDPPFGVARVWTLKLERVERLP